MQDTNKLQKNTELSIYNGVKDSYGDITTLQNVLDIISSNKYKDVIMSIRKSTTKEERSHSKVKLDAVTFAGTFSKREKQFIASASGIACLDFDKLENIESLKESLSKSEYTLACFISPSGKGLKLLIKIPLVIGDERYKEYYNAALNYYNQFKPDKSTKDISRLCFLSYDPEIYVNYDSRVFTNKVITPTYKPKVRSNNIIGNASESSTMKRLFSWWQRKHWDSSERNNSLYKLAAALCEFGVSETSAWSVIQTYEESDLPQYELKRILSSAYKRVEYNTKELA